MMGGEGVGISVRKSLWRRPPAVVPRSGRYLILTSLGLVASILLITVGIWGNWSAAYGLLPFGILILVSWTTVFRGWRLTVRQHDIVR